MVTLVILYIVITADKVPRVEWSKTFGGADDDYPSCVLQTSDGGYILSGDTYLKKTNEWEWDAWIIKTDEKGNELWRKDFIGNFNDHINSIQQTNEGGFILTGYTNGLNNYNAWIMKIDENGIEQWNRSFTQNFDPVSIQQTSDNGYIISGSIFISGSDHRDALLIKTDTNGIEEWNRIFDGEKGLPVVIAKKTSNLKFCQ